MFRNDRRELHTVSVRKSTTNHTEKVQWNWQVLNDGKFPRINVLSNARFQRHLHTYIWAAISRELFWIVLCTIFLAFRQLQLKKWRRMDSFACEVITGDTICREKKAILASLTYLWHATPNVSSVMVAARIGHDVARARVRPRAHCSNLRCKWFSMKHVRAL